MLSIMTYRHEITVILLKVALNAITLTADILTGFKKATLHNIYGHNSYGQAGASFVSYRHTSFF
jgi:hypothetical protein